MKVAVFSKRLIINGGTNMAGAAIPTLDGTTWLIAATAALPEAPAYSPSGVSIAIPCLISYHKKMRQLRLRSLLRTCWRMRGILTQLAAATAKRGTKRPIIPDDKAGLEEINLFKPNAVATLALVAATYAVPNCSFVTPAEALRLV